MSKIYKDAGALATIEWRDPHTHALVDVAEPVVVTATAPEGVVAPDVVVTATRTAKGKFVAPLVGSFAGAWECWAVSADSPPAKARCLMVVFD